MASPIFVVFLFLLSWRGCAVASRCSTKVEDVCSSVADTENAGFYDLHLTSQEYSTTELGKTQISVQVKMASTQPCPSLQTPGPKYYKLEAYSNDTLAPAGTFNDPPQSSEAEVCSDKAIVFNSCIPHVTDLPRTYGWNAPKTYIGNICFRLTILKNGEEICEEIVRCITQDQVAEPENKVQETVASNNTTVELEAVYVIDSHSGDSEHAAGCYKRRNCTNAKLKTMCGTDNKEYPSRCHVALERCLTGIKDLEVKHSGNCIPIPTTPPPRVSNCLEERERLLNSTLDTSQMWLPTCDCLGYYKPIQCDGSQSKCWCSTRKDGFLKGPKKYFNCERLDFSECLL